MVESVSAGGVTTNIMKSTTGFKLHSKEVPESTSLDPNHKICPDVLRYGGIGFGRWSHDKHYAEHHRVHATFQRGP